MFSFNIIDTINQHYVYFRPQKNADLLPNAAIRQRRVVAEVEEEDDDVDLLEEFEDIGASERSVHTHLKEHTLLIFFNFLKIK